MDDSQKERFLQENFDLDSTKDLIETIENCLKEGQLPPTYDNAQRLWDNFILTELTDGLRSSIRYAPIEWDKC